VRSLLFTITTILTLASTAWGQGYWLSHFNSSDGLPSNSIFRIAQDKAGFLWLGTDDGLVRYDGNAFRTFSHPDLLNHQIVKLTPTPNGNLTFVNIAGQGGHMDTESLEITVFNHTQSHESMRLIDVTMDDSGGVWMGVANAIPEDVSMVYQPNVQADKIEQLLHIKAGVNHLFWDKAQRVMYALTGNGGNEPEGSLYSTSLEDKYSPENWARMPVPLHPDYNWGYGTIYSIGNELLLLIPQSDLLYRIASDKVERIHIEGLPSDITMNSIAGVADGETWLATTKGAYRLNRVDSHTFVAGEPVLPNKQVNTVYIDREKNLWLGTTEAGLYMMSADRYRYWGGEYEGDSRFQVKKLSIGPDGEVIGITEKGELVVIKGGIPRLRAAFPPGEYNGLMFGAHRKGLLILNGATPNSVVEFGKGDLLNAPIRIQTLKQRNTKDAAWLGNEAFFGGGRFTAFLDSMGVSTMQNKIRVAAVIADTLRKHFWLGGEVGLQFATRGGDIQVYRTATGETFPYYIQSLALGNDSSLYIGTSGNGLWKLKDGNIAKVELSIPAISFRRISHHDNILWAVCELGVLKIDFETGQNTLLGGPGKTPILQPYDIIQVGQQVWLSTAEGLYTFGAEQPLSLTRPPPIELISFEAKNKEGLTLKTRELPPTYQEITLEFAGLSFAEKLSYEYRFRGENSWQALDVPYLRLSSLAPGNYTVEIVAIRPNGTRSDKPLRVSFSINYPFFLQPWFIVLSIALLIVAAFAIGKTYSRRKALQTQQKMEVERRVVASQLSALRAQMNPHFIFNCLTSIQQLLLGNQHEHTMEYLTQFAGLLRMAFENSRQEYIPLSKELAFLQTYIYLEEKRIHTPLEVSLHTDPALQPSFILIPGMLIQPLVENAFQHGLLHQNQPGVIRISLNKMEGSLISCSVEDNGIGFFRSQEINKKWKPSKRASGLDVTRERLTLIGTRIGRKLELIITELTDAEGEPTGTRVHFLLPYQSYD